MPFKTTCMNRYLWIGQRVVAELGRSFKRLNVEAAHFLNINLGVMVCHFFCVALISAG